MQLALLTESHLEQMSEINSAMLTVKLKERSLVHLLAERLVEQMVKTKAAQLGNQTVDL